MSGFANSFMQILKSSWQDDFIRGIMVGIGSYLVLVLLVHLVFILCRRRKKCAFFELPGEEGSVVVSIKAVTGVLRQELSDFKQLEISRITVYQGKEDYTVEIRESCDKCNFKLMPFLRNHTPFEIWFLPRE